MKNRLTERQQRLFRLFSRAIYNNPFSAKRRLTDCKISGLPETSSDRIILAKVLSLAAEEVSRFQQTEQNPLVNFTLEEDRYLVRNLYLFHVFHQFSSSLDEHISAQEENKAKRIPFKDAARALQILEDFGFSPADASHYLALFFQMRRAYFFIAHGLLGSSPSMMQLRVQLWNNIFTHDLDRYSRGLWQRMEDFSTLLLGETGTGKSLAAAAIGRSGFIPFDRKTQSFKENFTAAFVSCNLSQFSSELIESELFGHKKGAFTGALHSYEGLFGICSPYGAIFLDEIGDADIPTQIKLLRVLQERVFTKVGSQEEKRFSGRVIGATSQLLDELRHQGSFRNDFYFRLSSDRINIPPLRERIEEDPHELELLVNVLVKKILGSEDTNLSAKIVETIYREIGKNYPWLGNVRELEQCIRQVLLNNHCKGEAAPKSNLLPGSQLLQNIEAGTVNIIELTANYCSLLYKKHGSYQAVARVSGLDRRTVKKYLDIAKND